MQKTRIGIATLFALGVSIPLALGQDSGRLESVGPLEVRAVLDRDMGVVRLYNYLGDQIACLGRGGGHDHPWEAEPFYRVSALAIGADKLVHVSDEVEEMTYVFNYSGDLVRKIDHQGSAVSPAGKKTVYRTLEPGEFIFIRTWGSYGSGDGQFNYPEEIALDNTGNVYVADSHNHRIQVFSSTGRFIRTWGSEGSGDGQFDQPEGIALDNTDNVYVADSFINRIQVFSDAGQFIRKWGSIGSGDGQFWYPRGIALDNSGNVYVVDWGNHRIQVFSNTGQFIRTWGSYGSGNGQFDNPCGIALDNSGNVYVAEQGNHRIQVFSEAGQFITKWGSEGSGNGRIYCPCGIALDNSGNVYVADTWNHRIQVFSGGFYSNNGPSVMLNGKVTGFDNNNPPSLRLTGKDRQGVEFYADADFSKKGKYKFTNFPKGTEYRMEISAYDSQIYEADPQYYSGTAKNNIKNLNFKLETIVNRIYLRGRVVDRNGDGVGDVSIGGTLTGQDGSYSILVDINSTTTLTPQKDGYRFEPAGMTISAEKEDISGLDFLAIELPFITSLSPSSFTADALVDVTQDITITGGHLQGGLTISCDNTQVTFTDIQVTSSSQIKCKIKVPQKANKGKYSLTVTNPDGEKVTKDEAFEIK